MEKDLDKTLSNLCVVLLVCSQYLTTILGCYFPGKSDFFTLVIGLIVALFFVKLLYSPVRWVGKKFFFYAVLIVSAYGLTLFLCSERTNLTPIDFFGMCFIPFLIGGVLDYDGKTVIKWTMNMIVLAMPVFQLVFVKANAGTAYDAVSMGSSYALVPVIGAALVHFMLFRKESTVFDKISYFLNIVFLISFIQMSYRGPLVCLAVLFILCFIYNTAKQGITKQNVFKIVLLSIIILLVLIYLDQIFIFLYNILSEKNIRIAFLDKNRFLTSTAEGDLVHGRTIIWKTAWEGFIESPFWGHGLATFLYYTGYIFPHNFFLQLLYDGGLLLTIPIVSMIMSGIKHSVMKCQSAPGQFAFVIFAGGIALTRALISAEMWRIILLWLLLGYLSDNRRREVFYSEEHEFKK